jgi:dimethylamine/trimethylamine dehydrogenase
MAHSETDRLDRYRKTLLDHYEEEIMGEAYLIALAEHFDGEGEQDKLRLLGRVERRAAEVVQPLLHKPGLTSRDEAVLKSLGEADVAAHQGYSWCELMAYMAARYPAYLDDFDGLERLAPEADVPALKQLTLHEVAAIEFAGKEVAGEDDSAAPLHRYLEQCRVASTFTKPASSSACPQEAEDERRNSFG